MITGTPPRGLDLVRNEQDPVLVEDLLHRSEEAVGRSRETPDALDRLGDHARDVTRGRCLDDIAEIVCTCGDKLTVR